MVGADGGNELFLYTAGYDAAVAAQQSVAGLLSGHGLSAAFTIERWHPIEEEWEPADVALPTTAAAIEKERKRLDTEETSESKALGIALFEVRVQLPTHRDAVALAARLQAEGYSVARRWRFLVAGANNADQAEEFAARIRQEVPAGAVVTIEEVGPSRPYTVFELAAGSGSNPRTPACRRRQPACRRLARPPAELVQHPALSAGSSVRVCWVKISGQRAGRTRRGQRGPKHVPRAQRSGKGCPGADATERRICMGQQAELVFAGGAVYTADASRRRMVPATADDGSPASSVAVVGGRIEAIGNAGDRSIQELIGPATEVVDLRGRALLPGFQDAHVHPAFAGVTMIGCNLMGAANLDDALARIAVYAKQHPEREWIAGGLADGMVPRRNA